MERKPGMFARIFGAILALSILLLVSLALWVGIINLWRML